MKTLAIDKTSLALPEWPELAKKFGWHKTGKGVGTIGVELACLFCTVSRAPIAYVYGKANSSEDKLFTKLFKHLKPYTLLLIDNGFYAFNTFRKIRENATRHFIIPAAVSIKPKKLGVLGPHDYLAEITNSRNKNEKMTVRVFYVYRKGFRRKRLVTSLLDPALYPAAEIAALYHERWTIETFYNEFKNVMKANQWHCQTVESFKRELVCQMIVACLTKLAMSEAARLRETSPGKLSFSRAFTEVKSMFKRVLLNAGLGVGIWEVDYQELIDQCARHLIKVKPGRSFSRDRQEYRKKGRGLDRGKVGRPPKKITTEKRSKPEVHVPLKGDAVLLS